MSDSDTAFRVADRLRGRLDPPWEVYGERQRRYEVHFSGTRVEMTRGPVVVEGYGIRLLRPKGAETGVGYSSSSRFEPSNIATAVDRAEQAARHSVFPAKEVALPSGSGGREVETVDRDLWERPHETASGFLGELLEATSSAPEVVPSFGSIRIALSDVTIANSTGLTRAFSLTSADLEVAVKSFGGAEGAPPGEYWVNRRARRLPTRGIAREAERWARLARDVRHASPPPNGPQQVVLPTTVLADVIPAIIGYRFSGAAELRQMKPVSGAKLGPDRLTVLDDGTLPYGLGSAPFDDEGGAQGRRTLIDRGIAQEGLYDSLHAAHFGTQPTGNARRESATFPEPLRFPLSPRPEGTNIVIGPGEGGSDQELFETVHDGLFVDQLGYAFPDPISGAFGGEIRVAYRIRGGKLAEPVRGGTLGHLLIGGSGEPSMFQSLREVGGESHSVGQLHSPTCAFDAVSIAGGV